MSFPLHFLPFKVLDQQTELFFVFRYGDKTPKSIAARFFAILWIILGLIIMAVFMGNITSALTAASMEKETIQNKKVRQKAFLIFDKG